MFVEPNATSIRRAILTMLHTSGAGHLGCCMSAVEILMAMYESVDVEKIKRGDPDRDRVVISKGHCAAAVYATLAAYGILDPAELDTYHSDGSRLAGLVSHAATGVELSTGALGHGIGVAVGCALGLKAKGSSAKVLTIVGDSECQEGSVWEALMFASHQSLGNLTVIVDDNSIGSVTFTERVMRLPLWDMFKGFGVHVSELTNGHDLDYLKVAIGSQWEGPAPHVIIAHTVKGRGVSFAENVPLWHYKTLTDEQYEQAMGELADA